MALIISRGKPPRSDWRVKPSQEDPSAHLLEREEIFSSFRVLFSMLILYSAMLLGLLWNPLLGLMVWHAMSANEIVTLDVALVALQVSLTIPIVIGINIDAILVHPRVSVLQSFFGLGAYLLALASSITMIAITCVGHGAFTVVRSGEIAFSFLCILGVLSLGAAVGGDPISRRVSIVDRQEKLRRLNAEIDRMSLLVGVEIYGARRRAQGMLILACLVSALIPVAILGINGMLLAIFIGFGQVVCLELMLISDVSFDKEKASSISAMWHGITGLPRMGQLFGIVIAFLLSLLFDLYGIWSEYHLVHFEIGWIRICIACAVPSIVTLVWRFEFVRSETYAAYLLTHLRADSLREEMSVAAAISRNRRRESLD